MNLKCRQVVTSVSSLVNRQLRYSGSASKKIRKEKEKEDISQTTELEFNKTKDYIGPADSVSNLRFIRFRTEKQSTVEQRYHQQSHSIMKWNQEFWTHHNTRFTKEKEDFIAKRLKTRGGENNTALSAEEMSEFYREFLNKNYFSHFKYNIEWYKKNIGLLFPAIRVAMLRSLQKMSKFGSKKS